MTWKKTDGIENIFVSKATDYTLVYSDLMKVFKKLNLNTSNDFKNILIYTNATNGYLQVSWYNSETQKSLERSILLLELPKLWQKSIDHEEGAFYFDNETHVGICNFTEEMIEYEYDVYVLDEYNNEPEQLLV